MRIIDLNPGDQQSVAQVTRILFESFKANWPFPDIESAEAEVRKSFAPGNISRIALADDDAILGWIGAVPDYDCNVWVLHPLAVHPDFRERGVGRALVTDLEQITRERGAVTIYLGTDDTTGLTSLGNVYLYSNLFEHLSNIQNLGRHPYEFYLKLGFTIVGVIPDANGWAKPDILMAKRLNSNKPG